MKVVVLENAVLDSLASDPEAVRRLPQLLGVLAKRRAPARTGCGSCRDQADRQAKQLYATVKQAVPALSADGRTTLKSLLRADRVRVVLPGGGNFEF